MPKRIRETQKKDDHHDIGPDDLLSRFSDSELVSILSYLPPKDAVVTSKLSKSWRYLWCQTVRLTFENEQALYKIAENSKMYLKERNNFINWVNRVIRQHKSKKIDEFKISFHLGKESKCVIGKWIEFAISKDVHTLELDLSPYDKIRRMLGLNYVFPNKLFVMKFLKCLLLNAVNVNDEGLRQILSNCPALEHLSIDSSSGLVNPKFHGERLALTTLELRLCVGIRSVDLCDSNIVSFALVGAPIPIRFENPQKLKKLLIGEFGYTWMDTDLLPQISFCISYLQVLELELLEAMVLPFPVLPNLKQLILTVAVPRPGSLLELASLVEVCPNLLRFTVQTKKPNLGEWFWLESELQ